MSSWAKMKKRLFFLSVIYLCMAGVQSYAAQIIVPADLTTDTLLFDPRATAPSLRVSRIYYRSESNPNDDRLYYCFSTTVAPYWRMLDVDSKVATRIVSAYNSDRAYKSGSTGCIGDGTACANTKADFTCDGVDDQQEINMAINSLPASGGIVHLLEGTYNISANLLEGETIAGIVPHSDVAIFGTGRGTILKVKASVGNLNVINALNVNNVHIARMKIDGNSRTGTGNIGIRFANVSNSKISDVWAEDLSSAGIVINDAVGNPSTRNTVYNSNFRNNNLEGVIIASSDYNLVTNNNFEGNGLSSLAYAIKLDSAEGNIVSGNNISYITPGQGILLTNSSFDNTINANNVENSSGDGITLNSGSSRNNLFNNIIYSSNNRGLRLNNADNNAITSNYIWDDTTSGGPLYYGIELINDSDANLITSNYLVDFRSSGGTVGMSISDSTCDDNYIGNNLISREDGSAELIADSGTSTRYTNIFKLNLAVTQAGGAGATILDTSGSPKSYVRYSPSGNISLTLANSNNAGSVLMLENTSGIFSVSLSGANVKLTSNPLVLGANDMLTLIWMGGYWVQIGYSDN